MQKWGVVLYTQSLKYKGIRLYSHFKIFPMISHYALCTDGHDLILHILAAFVLPLFIAKSFLITCYSLNI